MKNKNEIRRALLTILCITYDEGMASVGYNSFDDTKRNNYILKQLKNIENWYYKDNHISGENEKITPAWLTRHNFKKVGDNFYSYQGGGSTFLLL